MTNKCDILYFLKKELLLKFNKNLTLNLYFY